VPSSLDRFATEDLLGRELQSARTAEVNGYGGSGYLRQVEGAALAGQAARDSIHELELLVIQHLGAV
jgi:hypothetical protein